MLGQIISHYRILYKLGEGGMGVVYVAEDIHLERRVAIKTLNIEPGKQHYRQRFLREARAVSALSHPNIAVVHDYGETDDGKPFIVMELVQGQTLEELLSQRTLTLSRVLEIIEDVVKALAEAHRRSIIHRDIKPSNVIINEGGVVKMLDFGLAKSLNADTAGFEHDPEARARLATQTREGVIIGTPLYLSPEQALGIPVDARSDIFSLGSLLYECITGRPAFPGTSAVAICAKVIRDDPPPPSQFNSHVPRELDRITLKLLAKKPEDRYQSADEILADLRLVRARLSTSSGVTPLSPAHGLPAPRTSALVKFSAVLRRPRTMAAAFIITLVLALSAVYALWSRHNAFSPPAQQETASLLEKGTEALRNGNYFAAIKILGEAIKKDGGNALAYMRRSEAWAELGNAMSADSDMKQAVARAHVSWSLTPRDILNLHALKSLVNRDTASAIRIYEKLAEVAPEGERAGAYVDLGRAYEKNEEVDKAIESYKKAANSQPTSVAASLRLGILYGRKGYLGTATEEIERAEIFYRAEKNYEGVTEALYQHGALLNMRKMANESRDKLNAAYDAARATGDKHQQLKVLLELSSIAASENNIERAKQYASSALALARESGVEAFVAQVLLGIGDVHLGGREKDEAERYFQQSLETARNYDGRRDMAKASLKLASLSEQRGKADDVLAYIGPALEFFQKGGYSKEYSDSLRLSGRAKIQKGDYKGAAQAFDEAVLVAKKTDSLAQVAATHLDIGHLFAAKEQYPEALRHFEESCVIGSELGERRVYAYGLLYRSDMFWRLGIYDKAESSLRLLADEIKLMGGKNEQIMSARMNVVHAQMALSRRDFPEAIAKSQEAIKQAQGVAPYALIEAEYTLGLAFLRSGSIVEGMRECQKAFDLAAQEDEPGRRYAALLALAEARLAGGDSTGALMAAREAKEYFARNDQKESEWQASLIAAQAALRKGDAAAAQAYNLEAEAYQGLLAIRWGHEAFQGYRLRRDVQLARQQISAAGHTR